MMTSGYFIEHYIIYFLHFKLQTWENKPISFLIVTNRLLGPVISYARREATSAAHCTAKFGLPSSSEFTYQIRDFRLPYFDRVIPKMLLACSILFRLLLSGLR
jgi:hypothetical protein